MFLHWAFSVQGTYPRLLNPTNTTIGRLLYTLHCFSKLTTLSPVIHKPISRPFIYLTIFVYLLLLFARSPLSLINHVYLSLNYITNRNIFLFSKLQTIWSISSLQNMRPTGLFAFPQTVLPGLFSIFENTNQKYIYKLYLTDLVSSNNNLPPFGLILLFLLAIYTTGLSELLQ